MISNQSVKQKANSAVLARNFVSYAKQYLYFDYRARDGTIQWKIFQRRMEHHAERAERLLAEGSTDKDPLAGKCRKILKHRQHLLTSIRDQQVEPTNNATEQVIPQAVHLA
ncbi:MAG: hypothetical protein K9N55_03590 [Phycisphaerae bacterium]|nr:hypothetical protein [Phycisphaerae bacterium]